MLCGTSDKTSLLYTSYLADKNILNINNLT